VSHKVVAFADLAGYTALTEAHGDEDAADVAARFYDLTAHCLLSDVHLVKPIGDAVMLAGSVADAVLTTVLRLNGAVEAQPGFPSMRTGLHAGPVVERDLDLFGATVNIAARVAAHARAGQILCTRSVRDAIGGGLPLRFLDPTLVRLRNVVEPIEIFEVVADGPPSSHEELDPVCRMHVSRRSAIRAEHASRTHYFCSERCRELFVQAPEVYLPSDRGQRGG